MGKFFSEIPESMIPWLLEQQMFWVATAPLAESGHINLSPKGVEGTFHVLNQHTVWYEDLSGSSVETISHIRENGRITILFSAFNGPPKLVRLYGTGVIYEFGTPEYDELLPPNKRLPGSRAAIVISVHKVGTNCGFAVPIYDFRCHRTRLLDFFVKREKVDSRTAAQEQSEVNSDALIPSSLKPKPFQTAGGLKAYWKDENTRSLDGLPGLVTAFTSDAVPNKGEIIYLEDDLSIIRPPQIAVATKSDASAMVPHPVSLVSSELLKLLIAFSIGLMTAGMWGRFAALAYGTLQGRVPL